MKIETIVQSLAVFNGSAGEPEKKAAVKKVVPAVKAISAPAAPALKTNGHASITKDEMLALVAPRIVKALGLDAHSVTPEMVVTKVQEYERPYEGRVM